MDLCGRAIAIIRIVQGIAMADTWDLQARFEVRKSSAKVRASAKA